MSPYGFAWHEYFPHSLFAYNDLHKLSYNEGQVIVIHDAALAVLTDKTEYKVTGKTQVIVDNGDDTTTVTVTYEMR